MVPGLSTHSSAFHTSCGDDESVHALSPPIIPQLASDYTSTLLDFGMASFKEKHHANSHSRKHSGIIRSQSRKKSKTDENTDTDRESVSCSSPSSADAIVVPAPESSKCPIRYMLAGMLEAEDDAGGEKLRECSLR
ncbi:NADH dehydrogenase subunit D [Marssonina coronariae]|uniref:NADH dehydrogenase subunit D n=1 Tax=Diplocarpon coronariae TaxID=2795749 RepID=A0A218Z818_9HELO|nr:NADH dehydrogenase subunit D [Marssonina coronariae]